MEQALPDIAFDGWAWDVAERAAETAGYSKDMASAVFPGGLSDFVGHFSDLMDRRMMDVLAVADRDDMRIRDRIRTAVLARLDAVAPWKEAYRRAVTYWAIPHRSLMAGRHLWRTADVIWTWAGDTATDYNRYTKRGLLSGVISATMLAWLKDDGDNREAVEAFLDRRIENVMQLGKVIGRFKKSA